MKTTQFASKTDWRGDDLFAMTSMVDVVFILLAFFVLSTRFVGAEHDVSLGGERLTATGTASVDDLPTVIVLRMTPTATGGAALHLEGASLPDDDYQAITDRLIAINVPTMDVVIAADEALSVDQVARALDAALASPMKRVSLAGRRDASTNNNVAPTNN